MRSVTAPAGSASARSNLPPSELAPGRADALVAVAALAVAFAIAGDCAAAGGETWAEFVVFVVTATVALAGLEMRAGGVSVGITSTAGGACSPDIRKRATFWRFGRRELRGAAATSAAAGAAGLAAAGGAAVVSVAAGPVLAI